MFDCLVMLTNKFYFAELIFTKKNVILVKFLLFCFQITKWWTKTPWEK